MIIIPPVDRSSVMSQVLVGWLQPPPHSVISGGHDANDAAAGSGRVALPLPPTFNFSLLIIYHDSYSYRKAVKLFNISSYFKHLFITCNVYTPMFRMLNTVSWLERS